MKKLLFILLLLSFVHSSGQSKASELTKTAYIYCYLSNSGKSTDRFSVNAFGDEDVKFQILEFEIDKLRWDRDYENFLSDFTSPKNFRFKVDAKKCRGEWPLLNCRLDELKLGNMDLTDVNIKTNYTTALRVNVGVDFLQRQKSTYTASIELNFNGTLKRSSSQDKIIYFSKSFKVPIVNNSQITPALEVKGENYCFSGGK